jgi:serine/threonine-protein kinase
MLPGDRAVLFTITATSGGPDAAQVAVLDLATNKYRRLIPGGSDAHYVPSGLGSPKRAEREGGHLVYTAGGALLAVPFDLDRLETYGSPVTMLPRVVTDSRGAGAFDVAADDGTLAYLDAPGAAASSDRTLVWVDRRGGEDSLHTPPHPYLHPRLSPNGTLVAVATADQASAIWVWDLAGGTLSQRTFGQGGDFSPVWTKNGSRLLFRRTAGLFWQPADGTGLAEELGTGIPSGITPNGTQVLLSTSGGSDLMMLTLDGTHHVDPLVKTRANERNGVVSPDGRWLAYESDVSDKFEIYVKPFPRVDDGIWRISTAGGTRPLWARSGDELFFVGLDGAIMAVRVEPRGGAWSASLPVKVVEGLYSTGNPFSPRNYDVSLDGKRFLMVKELAKQAAAPQIIVVQNWVEELKRLVPTR